MTDPTRRPWWRKRRWVAVGVVWLMVAYPLSLWPVAYGVGRGWLPKAPAVVGYAPVLYGADAVRPHPGIGLGPPDAEGRRPYIVTPDPDPWPRPVASTAEAYLDAVQWFSELGERHAGK